VSTYKTSLTSFGTFAVDVPVPQTAKLGSYALVATIGTRDDEAGDIHGSFEIAEYRPAEFKVGVESERPSYVRGDMAHWSGQGDYLFGAPMAACRWKKSAAMRGAGRSISVASSRRRACWTRSRRSQWSACCYFRSFCDSPGAE